MDSKKGASTKWQFFMGHPLYVDWLSAINSALYVGVGFRKTLILCVVTVFPKESLVTGNSNWHVFVLRSLCVFTGNVWRLILTAIHLGSCGGGRWWLDGDSWIQRRGKGHSFQGMRHKRTFTVNFMSWDRKILAIQSLPRQNHKQKMNTFNDSRRCIKFGITDLGLKSKNSIRKNKPIFELCLTPHSVYIVDSSFLWFALFLI